MKPARIAVICIAAVSALGLALVVRAMGNGEPAAPAAAAPVETRKRAIQEAMDQTASEAWQQPKKQMVEATA